MKAKLKKAQKKRHNLNRPKICLDPFPKIPVYRHRNGRIVGYKDGRWQAV